MGRTKRRKQVVSQRDAICIEEVTESTTLKQTLPDGNVIRHDPPDFWVDTRFGSWTGTAPTGWDPTQAIEEAWEISYEYEMDYS